METQPKHSYSATTLSQILATNYHRTATQNHAVPYNPVGIQLFNIQLIIATKGIIIMEFVMFFVILTVLNVLIHKMYA